MHKLYDVLIVGAGPIGLACAIEAHKVGLNYVVVEKGVLANSVFHFPANMTFFSTSKLMELGDVPFISHNSKPTRSEALEYFRRVRDSWKLNVHLYEAVTQMEKGNVGRYTVLTEKASYETNHIILATGFYDLPVLMHVPGEDLPKVKHYYDDPHHYVGQKVVVVGAANSACDAALETWDKGAEVTMVIRSESIYKGVKYWIKPNIENRIKEGSIKAYFNASVTAISKDAVQIQTPEGLKTLENDFVLAMTGYQPNYAFIEKFGIHCAQDQYKSPSLNEQYESTNPGVYMAGVVCGGLKTNRFIIENSRVHADIIVQDILAKMEVSKIE